MYISTHKYPNTYVEKWSINVIQLYAVILIYLHTYAFMYICIRMYITYNDNHGYILPVVGNGVGSVIGDVVAI